MGKMDVLEGVSKKLPEDLKHEQWSDHVIYYRVHEWWFSKIQHRETDNTLAGVLKLFGDLLDSKSGGTSD